MDELRRMAPEVLKKVRHKKLSRHPEYSKKSKSSKRLTTVQESDGKLVDEQIDDDWGPVAVGQLPESGHVPTAQVTDQPPWIKYGDNIISFDCEFVSKPKTQGQEKVEYVGGDGIKRINFGKGCTEHLATVTVVNYKNEVIFKATVQHEAGSYSVTDETLRVNGFKYNTFELDPKARPFDIVKKEFEPFLRDKFIVTKTGVKDFKALELDVTDYKEKWFDLDTYYRRMNGNPFKLKFLCKKIVGKDIQVNIHKCEEDAIATMQIFKIMQQNYKKHLLGFDDDLEQVNFF